MCCFGSKPQVSQQPLRRGWLGRAAGPGDMGTPERLGLLGDVESWTSALGSFSGAGNLKGRSGGSLNTKLCWGLAAVRHLPSPGAVSGSVSFSITNAISPPPLPAPKAGWGFLRSLQRVWAGFSPSQNNWSCIPARPLTSSRAGWRLEPGAQQLLS